MTMSAPAGYTPFHPKWYRSRVSVWWWLRKPAYALFVLRELTSVPVALFALVTLWGVHALREGPEAYAAFQGRMRTPGFVALHVLALAAVLFHSVTWFNLAPKAIVVRLGGWRAPDALIAGSNYLLWVVLSAGVAFLLLRR